MDWKFGITIFSAVVGGFSAYQAKLSSDRASELAESKFGAESVIGLLKLAHDEIEKSRSLDDTTKQAACIFVTKLVSVEQSYVNSARPIGLSLFQQEPPAPEGILSAYFASLSSEGFVSPTCNTAAENILLPATVGEPAAPTSVPDAATAELGRWHAVIASYKVNERGCTNAGRNVDEFARDLSGLGFGGRRIAVVKTRLSDNYAVTIDAGDNRDLAQQISAAIRSVGSKRGDKDGADSFVQENRSWSVAPECTKQSTLSG